MAPPDSGTDTPSTWTSTPGIGTSFVRFTANWIGMDSMTSTSGFVKAAPSGGVSTSSCWA